MKYNRRDIPKLEAEIKALIKAEGSDETKAVEDLVAEYVSPNTGLIYNTKTGKLKLAEGYVFDANGDIVLLDNIANPGTGMIYKDGKLVPAE